MITKWAESQIASSHVRSLDRPDSPIEHLGPAARGMGTPPWSVKLILDGSNLNPAGSVRLGSV